MADSVSLTEVEFVVAAPPFIATDPMGGVVSEDEDWRVIESEYDVDVNPAPFLNCTYIVFAPSPLVSVHALDEAYGSQPDHEDPSLLKRISFTPDSGSVADSVRTTETELVVAAFPLITMDPVGGEVSVGGANCP